MPGMRYDPNYWLAVASAAPVLMLANTVVFAGSQRLYAEYLGVKARISADNKIEMVSTFRQRAGMGWQSTAAFACYSLLMLAFIGALRCRATTRLAGSCPCLPANPA